jgi:hypothetical protein
MYMTSILVRQLRKHYFLRITGYTFWLGKHVQAFSSELHWVTVCIRYACNLKIAQLDLHTKRTDVQEGNRLQA